MYSFFSYTSHKTSLFQQTKFKTCVVIKFSFSKRTRADEIWREKKTEPRDVENLCEDMDHISVILFLNLGPFDKDLKDHVSPFLHLFLWTTTCDNLRGVSTLSPKNTDELEYGRS